MKLPNLSLKTIVAVSLLSGFVTFISTTNAKEEKTPAKPAVAKSEIKNLAVGQVAPDFTATGADGKTYKLSDFKGKVVVMEWFNDDCPYVEKHYGSNNMQNLQKTYTSKGVVWLTVGSNKKDSEGYMDKGIAAKVKADRKMASTAILLDEKGELGRQYGAQTTPHMYVIDSKGMLVYQGAIDSVKSSKKSTIKEATNYVALALDAVLAGKPVLTASTEPYGCSVKY